MIEALQYEFMRNALIAGLLASVACGVVGSYIVIKRIVLISGGISHASFGGIGLGYYLGINPILGAVFFSIASAMGIGIISKKAAKREDTAIAILWSLGMGLGILFISLTPGYAPDLFSYLFGSILTVPRSYNWTGICFV
jgi:zinc transport system permease protein